MTMLVVMAAGFSYAYEKPLDVQEKFIFVDHNPCINEKFLLPAQFKPTEYSLALMCIDDRQTVSMIETGHNEVLVQCTCEKE
jgi:hypothetical protein